MTNAEQQRIFAAVDEFRQACACAVGGKFGADQQRRTLEQMIYSSILNVYGSSWVVDFERDICASTVTHLLKVFSDDKAAAYVRIQHEEHKEPDDDCELCIAAAEAAEG